MKPVGYTLMRYGDVSMDWQPHIILEKLTLYKSALSLIAMSLRSILLIIFDILVFIICARLVFKSFKEFKKAIFYIIKPNILSIIQRDFTNDFNYTYKMIFVILIMVVIIFIEISIFY